jgi:hypothetical protein
MQNIEDLVKQIVSSPIFKNEIQMQLKECIEERDETPRQCFNTVPLPDLIDEINGYIT